MKPVVANSGGFQETNIFSRIIQAANGVASAKAAQPAYTADRPTYTAIRHALALPFIPEESIPAILNRIRSDVRSDRLISLFNYIEETWLNGQFPPNSWCVYGRSVRTNNDVEGWHRRLNHRAQKGEVIISVNTANMH